MKVLVTGSAGFLGRWFTDHHIQAGDEVVGIDDLSNAERPLDQIRDSKRYEFIRDDAAEYLDGANREYDRAYHFAAPVGGRLKIEGDPLFNADSLRLDSVFFRWAIRRTKLAIYPSSSAVYGAALQGADAAALVEGLCDPAKPVWYAPDEMYGFTKLAGEILAYKAQRYGLNTLCIRPFSGYGEGQSQEYPIPAIAKRILDRKDPLIIWGSGDQRRDFIHVRDLVGATIARLEHPVVGYEALNLGSGVSTSFVEAAQIMAEIVGYGPQIKVDSSKPEGVKNRWADISRMLTHYRPTITLKDGLARVLEDVHANYG